MKKIIISLIILLAGALTFLIYSAINERRFSPVAGEGVIKEKKAEADSEKKSSGFTDAPLGPIVKIEEPVTVKNETEKPIEDTTYKEKPATKAEERLEVALADKEIRIVEEKTEIIPAAPPAEIKRKEAVRPAEKEKGGPAEKKESVVPEGTSVKAESIEAAPPVVAETIRPVVKPDIIKKEGKTGAAVEQIKQPVTETELVREEPRVVEEKAEIIPAGRLILKPIETPAATHIELSSVGMKNIMPERAKEDAQVKIEKSVAVNPPEKVDDTDMVIPAAVKAAVKMEQPEPSSGDVLTKGSNRRIAIFPFQNLSDNRDAYKNVLPLLIDKMEKKGLEVVDDDVLTAFLCKERVRSTGYISRELSDKIRNKFKVSAILTGAIISFSTEEIPQFGILARMTNASDGTILWADYSAATGDDFIAILELGRLKTVFSLIPRVIDILFTSFKSEVLNGEMKPLNRIAVMPFKNNSEFNNAGIIATYMFIVEMFKRQQFIPVEYGDTRDVIIKQSIKHKGDIGYENIGGLSKELKARGIVVGVVDSYSDGLDSSSAPHVGITARLIDGSNNKILWYNSFQLSGEDNIIALDWGRIRSVHSVAYKAISSLVKEMGKKKWPD